MDIEGLDGLVGRANGTGDDRRRAVNYLEKLSNLVDTRGRVPRNGDRDAEKEERVDEHVRRLAYGVVNDTVGGVQDRGMTMQPNSQKVGTSVNPPAIGGLAGTAGESTRKVRKDRPADIIINHHPLIGSRHLPRPLPLASSSPNVSSRALMSPQRLSHFASTSLKQYSLAESSPTSAQPSPSISLPVPPDSATPSTSDGRYPPSIVIDLTTPPPGPSPRPRVRFASTPLRQATEPVEADEQPKVWEPFLPLPSRAQYEVPPHRSWNEALEKPTQQLRLWREYVGAVHDYCAGTAARKDASGGTVALSDGSADINTITDSEMLRNKLKPRWPLSPSSAKRANACLSRLTAWSPRSSIIAYVQTDIT